VESAFGHLIEDWEEWNIPWTGQLDTDSWPEDISRIREGIASTDFKLLFSNTMEKYINGDVEAQLEAINVLVELMVGQEDAKMVIEGSWDEQTQPCKAEHFSWDESTTHMEIVRLMTDTGVQEDNSAGVQPKSLLDRYFTFGEEYLEHQEMEKLQTNASRN
jgi:hypothetical protein